MAASSSGFGGSSSSIFDQTHSNSFFDSRPPKIPATIPLSTVFVTAINLGDTDGNPATVADPTWAPLVTTPNYPEYASGHACITGSATNTFSYLFGSRHIDMNVYSSVTATTRHYANSVALDNETKNARIWLGLHFRTGMNAGNRIGHFASRWTISHVFQPTCDRRG